MKILLASLRQTSQTKTNFSHRNFSLFAITFYRIDSSWISFLPRQSQPFRYFSNCHSHHINHTNHEQIKCTGDKKDSGDIIPGPMDACHIRQRLRAATDESNRTDRVSFFFSPVLEMRLSVSSFDARVILCFVVDALSAQMIEDWLHWIIHSNNYVQFAFICRKCDNLFQFKTTTTATTMRSGPGHKKGRPEAIQPDCWAVAGRWSVVGRLKLKVSQVTGAGWKFYLQSGLLSTADRLDDPFL